MRRARVHSPAILLLLATLFLTACLKEEARPKEDVEAEQTLAEVIRAVNAKDRAKLGQLLTLTSTAGGHVSLTETELARLMLPEPPIAYLSPGPPGSVDLVDAQNMVRRLRLVRVDGEWKALASRAPLSRYRALEAGGSVATAAPGADVEVVYFLPRAKK